MKSTGFCNSCGVNVLHVSARRAFSSPWHPKVLFRVQGSALGGPVWDDRQLGCFRSLSFSEFASKIPLCTSEFMIPSIIKVQLHRDPECCLAGFSTQTSSHHIHAGSERCCLLSYALSLWMVSVCKHTHWSELYLVILIDPLLLFLACFYSVIWSNLLLVFCSQSQVLNCGGRRVDFFCLSD